MSRVIFFLVLVPGLELKKFFFSHQSFVITACQQSNDQKTRNAIAKPRKVLSYPDKAKGLAATAMDV